MEIKEFKLCLENAYENDGELDANIDTFAMSNLTFFGMDMIVKVDPSQDIRNLIQIRLKDGLSSTQKEIPTDVVPIIMYILSEPETTFKSLYRNNRFCFQRQSLYRDILNTHSNIDEICMQFRNGQIWEVCDNTSIGFEENSFCIFEWYSHLFRRKKAIAMTEKVKQFSCELFNYVDMVLKTKC